MTSGGIEALKAAVRRSLPLIVGLVVVGILAVNVFKLIQGPRYEASARVLTSTTPLSNIITGTQPSFVDPERLQETAVGIAQSQEVYDLAAEQSNEMYGDASELKSKTTVQAEQNSDLISFNSSASDADAAVGTVNAVTDGYIAFRKQLSSSQIKNTIEGLRSGLPGASDPSGRLQTQLNKLLVLQQSSSDTQIVQAADSADKTSPALVKDTLLGFSIGLVIALLTVALREAIDTTIRSEADVEDELSVPLLASVRPTPRRTRLVTYGRHEAEFGDAYGLIAAQLLRADEDREQGVVLGVTSSVAREGKTTTAANLAVTFARRGHNVILADFDFRKSALSDVFALPRDAPGALQVMSRGAALPSALCSVTLEGPGPRLSQNGHTPDATPAPPGGWVGFKQQAGSLRLLPTGGSTRTSPPQSHFRPLIRELQDSADLVILDTPPALLTVEVAELSQLIDMIVLVVRQGRASHRNLRALRRQARTWPAEMVGVVMTDVQAERGKYSYYGAS